MADQTTIPGAQSIDNVTARNNTLIIIQFNGQRVGRVQQFREGITNNVQVLAELGRAYMVEMKKGITAYSFSISKFMCRNDVMDQLKLGAVFSLSIRDEGVGLGAETIEYFPSCMINSMSRDYTIGQASVGESAEVVTIGKGVQLPTLTV